MPSELKSAVTTVVGLSPTGTIEAENDSPAAGLVTVNGTLFEWLTTLYPRWAALDEEAARRGNSTYLVDRVVPMLPEALSNELCSLKPEVERLTKCVEFLLSSEGQVLKAQFYPAVIRSQRRYNYRDVFALLQRRPQDPIEQMLHDANTLTQKIRRARFKAGSLDLDFPETKIRLDDQGRVLRMEKVENDVSHQLIEECMLLANEAVAATAHDVASKPPGDNAYDDDDDETFIREVHPGFL